MPMEDAYLMHHGVKGMKWGVHNAETEARYRGESRSRATKAAKTALKVAAVAGVAVAATNPATLAAGAAAVNAIVTTVAPPATKLATKSLIKYGVSQGVKAGAKAVNSKFKIKNKKARNMLEALSKATITELAVNEGMKVVKPFLEEFEG